MAQPSVDDLVRIIAYDLARRARCPVAYINTDTIRTDVMAAISGDGGAGQRLDALLAASPAHLLEAYRALQGQAPPISLEDALRGLHATRAIPGRASHPLLRAIEVQTAVDPETQGSLLLTMPGAEPRRLRTLDDLRDELRRPWTSNPRYGCRLALVPSVGRRVYDVLRQVLAVDPSGDG